MNKKTLTLLLTASLLTTGLVGNSFATGDDVLDLGSDTANPTNDTNNSTGNDLDLGSDTNNSTNNDLDLGGDNGDTNNQNTQDNVSDTNNTTEQTPTYEKDTKKDNTYKFDVLIKDASKSYVVKFATGDKDLVLSNFIINNNNVSDNLKKSLSLIIKDWDKSTVVKMEDLDVKPVNVPKSAELYLVYNPDGVDNSSELSLSDNKLNIYAEEIRQPAQEGELNYNNWQIEIVNPVDYTEATVNYDVKPELIKTSNEAKKSLTKKDTWPVENTVALVLAILLVITGIAMTKKEENA